MLNFICSCTSAIITFSEAHGMSCFQCVRIELHTPSLKNVENSTSNFYQLAQICCREEEREYWQLRSFLRYTQKQ